MINNTSSSDLISIVIPVYNSGKYLANCLQSCIDQTYSNLEVVIVDDHSTDPLTLQLLEEFASKDKRIRVVYCKENHGPGFCRNLGIKESRGKYFAFADSDDLMSLDFCERMLNAIQEFKTDFVMCDVVKEYDYQSFQDSELASRIDKADSQFNLVNAKDRTILSTEKIAQQSCLLYFPANCYGKLFDMQKYRAAGILFADTPDARTCQDQDWRVNTLINLKNCLTLKFIGYRRIVHLGSISIPSPKSYIHGIAALYRIYKLICNKDYFHHYQSDIIYNMFDRAVTRYKVTDDFIEHQNAVCVLNYYLNKCDSKFSLNPFHYSVVSSTLWGNIFQKMYANPLPLLYFSLRPLHDKYSLDRHYIRELFENLATYGVKTIVFNGAFSSTKSSAQQLLDIQKECLEANSNKERALNQQSSTPSSNIADLNKLSSGNLSKSALIELYDNGIVYAVANTSRDLPELYSHKDLSVIYLGVQLYLESKFKQPLNNAQLKANSSATHSVESNQPIAVEGTSEDLPLKATYGLLKFPRLPDIVAQDEGNDGQTINAWQTNNEDKTNVEHTTSIQAGTNTPSTKQPQVAHNTANATSTKQLNPVLSQTNRIPRARELFVQPKIAMISGGDLVTQQVCRNLKAAGCKVVYLLTDEHDLKFQTLNLESSTRVTSLAQNIVPSDMPELIAALNTQNQADYMLDCAEINVENAQRYLQYIKQHEAQLKAKTQQLSSDEQTTTHQGQPLPDNNSELTLDDITDELLQQLEEKMNAAALTAQEAASKVAKIKTECAVIPEKSPLNSDYLFAPEEFDAVLCFNPQLAQKFIDTYQVPVESLGYVLNLQVNTSGNKGSEVVHQLLAKKSSMDDKSKEAAYKSKDADAVDKSIAAKSKDTDAKVPPASNQSDLNSTLPSLEQYITFQQPVLENGLAVFIKLVDAYTKRHPDAKFLILQDSDDNLVQALNKLHDKAGNTLAKLKPNLSSLKVSSIQKIDPIAACLQSKVLLKLGLHENASICGLPEALLNDIPVLASNQPHYAHLINNAGKLLDIPHCTLQDPSCMPDDEEITPFLEALETLMNQEMSQACKEAAQALDFNQNADAWAHRLFDIAKQSYPLTTNQSSC